MRPAFLLLAAAPLLLALSTPRAHAQGGARVSVSFTAAGSETPSDTFAAPAAVTRLPRARRVIARPRSWSTSAYGDGAGGAVVFVMREDSAMLGVDAFPVRPTRERDRDSLPEPAAPSSTEPCTEVSAFFIDGVGERPSRPVSVEVRQRESQVRLEVDPRRHTLRARGFVRVTAEELARAKVAEVAALRVRATPRSRGVLPLVVYRGRDGWDAFVPEDGAYGFGPPLRVPPHGEWRVYLIDRSEAERSLCAGPEEEDDTPVDYAAEEIDAPLSELGVTPLAWARPRPGERELRLTSGGWVDGPRPIVRLIERRGRIIGELYVVQRLVEGRFPGGARPPVLERCARPVRTRDRLLCRVRPARPVDWARVWAAADSAGAWTLPAPPPAEAPRLSDQGWDIVARLDARGYFSAYYYGASPDGPEPGRGAARLGRLAREVLEGKWSPARQR